jgi:hypothetical protein
MWIMIRNTGLPLRLSRIGNTAEREVTVSGGPQDLNVHQFVTVNAEEKKILTNITEEPVKGTRVLTVSPSVDPDTTRIEVLWNIDLSGVPFFAKGLAKDGITKTTEEAFTKIAQAAE